MEGGVMHGVQAMCVALGIAAGICGGCSGKKSEPELRKESAAAAAPSPPVDGGPMQVQARGGTPTAPVKAVPPDAAPARPDPFAAQFPERHTPNETLPEKMRRRIRYHLREKTKAPVALHHVIDIRPADGGRDVYGIYEYSLYEDCVLGYPTRKEGREHCQAAPVKITDHDKYDKYYEYEDGRVLYRSKEVRLNGDCMALGAVRAHFDPPDATQVDSADAGGKLTLWSTRFLDVLCKPHAYQHVFVTEFPRELPGAPELGAVMYVDLTTSAEITEDAVSRSTGQNLTDIDHSFRRNLYLFFGNDAGEAALANRIAEWKHLALDPEELIELRDINQDGALDVVQTAFCIPDSILGLNTPWEMGRDGRNDEYACGWKARQKFAYVYDPKKGAWTFQSE
jgi:hypothetical protein